jgi:putative peptidoglycan lipid II flippase
VAAFGDNMLVLAIALSTLVGLAGAAVAPVVLPPLMSHLSSSGASEVHQLYFALLPFIVLSTVTTLLSAVLNAHDRFGTTSSAPALTPALTIVMIIVAHAIGARGAFALATGLIAGACAELLVTVRALRATGVSLRLRWHGFDAHTRKVIEQYAPMLLTAFFAAASPMVDQSFAVRVGAGSVSAINYATKLVALSIALGYVPLSAATLPHLSGMVAAGQWADIRRALRRGSMLLALATVPATVLLMAVSRPLTAAIFERGAFTVEDTHIVSHLTSIYAAQIPFFLVSILPMRLLSAMGKNQHVMVITLGNVALNAFGDWALTARMGLAGIALSSALVCGWSCAVYFTVTAVLLRDKRAS